MILDPIIASAFKIAAKFGAREGEQKLFATAWRWRARVDKQYRNEGEKIARELERQFGMIATAVKTGRMAGELGHTHLFRAPTEGRRYVIFSDHHWADSGNRQNFFGFSGNRTLYCDALDAYFKEGYTLIENGDVEELIIFEPDLAEIKRRAGLEGAALRAHRLKMRTLALRQILADPGNQRLYATLNKFHQAGRYIKVIGNHDYDLQVPELLAELRKALPGLPVPYDYAFLETGGQVDYVIAHGHHFDASTNPVYAAAFGETISESLSWAYQGPDRTWRWNDQTDKWARGQAGYNNRLVSDDYNKKRGGVFDKISAALNMLHSKDAWEALFKHNIAWEYFENEDPMHAIQREVRTGDEFFKFRHMDEIFVMEQLNRHFGETDRPKLILGHTHEVRYFPAYVPEAGRPPNPLAEYPWIFNSGAAGRFENLLWAIEVDNSRPRLVSWNRAQPGSGALERHVYRRQAQQVHASRAHVPLHPEPVGLNTGRRNEVVVDFFSNRADVSS